MTTGTKIFLAVFALIIGTLVVYYGVADRTEAGPDNKVADGGQSDEKVARQPSAVDSAGAMEGNADRDRRTSPAPRQATPLAPAPDDIGPPANASAAGGLLSEGVREATGEPNPAPNAFLPLMGLNGNEAQPASDSGRNGAAAPPATQPQSPRAPAPSGNGASQDRTPSAGLANRPPLRIEHIIKTGDTYTSIAQEWFGDGTKWTLIAKENPTVDPARLKIGQKIYLPPKDAAAAKSASGPAATPEIVPAEGELIYTVQEGDTLSSIARQHYNDPAKWKDIYDLNRKIIGSDAGALQVGTKLRLKMVKRGS